MIGSGLTKDHLRLFFISTLILMLLAGGFNLLIYPQTTAVLEKLEREHQDNSALHEELDRLNSSYNELQSRYELLKQEKEELEIQLQKNSLPVKTGGGPTAYLTIDDGPEKYTAQILQTLAEYDVPATFFVMGKNNSGDENMYDRILEQGHTLGNHTMTHNLKKIYLSKDAFMTDLLRLEDLLEQKAGVRPDIIRFPGGSSNTVAAPGVMKEIIAELAARGYDYFDWNISTGDCNTSLTAAQLVANVVSQADRRPGQDLVVLMHDFNHATAEALPRIIENLHQRGYTFAALEKGIINMKHR
ncbi:MAG: polysaccharide deacetylase family protein [Firmicutes bacterium]|nr:polysaccharide deacetylase family protein [Bacillota bacterium]